MPHVNIFLQFLSAFFLSLHKHNFCAQLKIIILLAASKTVCNKLSAVPGMTDILIMPAKKKTLILPFKIPIIKEESTLSRRGDESDMGF